MTMSLDRWRTRWSQTAQDLTELHKRLDNQRQRIDQQAERLARQRDRIERYTAANQRLRDQIKRLNAQVERHQAAIKDIKQELGPVQSAHAHRELDFRRSLQQLGTLETRLGRIEAMLEPNNYTSDDAALAEARNLVDTVRREHDQARVRFQIISAYEERLRRVEAAVIAMYDGDLRHPL